MALGAAPGRVIAMVLQETAMMLAIGAVLGLALTIACTRLISAGFTASARSIRLRS